MKTLEIFSSHFDSTSQLSLPEYFIESIKTYDSNKANETIQVREFIRIAMFRVKENGKSQNIEFDDIKKYIS